MPIHKNLGEDKGFFDFLNEDIRAKIFFKSWEEGHSAFFDFFIDNIPQKVSFKIKRGGSIRSKG